MARSRWKFVFRLRTMLIAVCLAGLAGAVWYNDYARMKRAEAEGHRSSLNALLVGRTFTRQQVGLVEALLSNPFGREAIRMLDAENDRLAYDEPRHAIYVLTDPAFSNIAYLEVLAVRKDVRDAPFQAMNLADLQGMEPSRIDVVADTLRIKLDGMVTFDVGRLIGQGDGKELDVFMPPRSLPPREYEFRCPLTEVWADGKLVLTGDSIVAGAQLIGVPVAEAQLDRAKRQGHHINNCVELHEANQGRPLTEQEGLAAVQILSPVFLNDPWGHPWVYRPTDPTAQAFEVRSNGPDGRPGTEDDVVFSRDFNGSIQFSITPVLSPPKAPVKSSAPPR